MRRVHRDRCGRRGWGARLALAAALALALACGGKDEIAIDPDLVVVVSPVQPRTLDLRIIASGELQALEEAQIAAEIDGRITEILHVEGDAVTTGDVVLRIDPERRHLGVESARASLAEADASLREARREHARVRNLEKRGASSSAQLDSITSALEAAESRHRAAKAQLGVALRMLRDADVEAPFDGVVARRLVSRGEFVSPGTPLFELVAHHPLEVVFHVSEADSGRVQEGSPVAVRVASHPDEEFEATVTMVSPKIDRRTRTLRVKAAIDNTEGRLRPGLFARVDLGVETRPNVPMIPEEAVLQRAAGPIVFLLGDEGRAVKREVETGLHEDGEVEVVGGLSLGEWVISQGHSRLVDGMRVRPQRANGEPFDLRTARASTDDAEASLP